MYLHAAMGAVKTFMPKVWKTGNSNVVTIPADIMELMKLKPGDRIVMILEKI